MAVVRMFRFLAFGGGFAVRGDTMVAEKVLVGLPSGRGANKERLCLMTPDERGWCIAFELCFRAGGVGGCHEGGGWRYLVWGVLVYGIAGGIFTVFSLREFRAPRPGWGFE